MSKIGFLGSDVRVNHKREATYDFGRVDKNANEKRQRAR